MVDLETKDCYRSDDVGYDRLLLGKYTDEITTSCLILKPTGVSNQFFVQSIKSIYFGRVYDADPYFLSCLEIPLCANYAIGPQEYFIRIDAELTRVSDDERVDGDFLVNSTHIKSGHLLITKDIKIGEVGGEMRFHHIRDSETGSIIQIDHFNLQSSVFDYPDMFACNTLAKFGISESLYKTNEWDQKGRKSKKKYL